MGERKGVNKYYPPDFDPKKHRNLNAYHGTHALRDRGKKASQGILTIRFEMPFNSWCLTCKNPIGMGVRYNAQKSKVGMYHSTPIYRFTMPCHLCAGTIVFQTDPQNFDYIILEGARRKDQKWDPEENEQILIADAQEKKKLATDAMYHLEHDVKDKAKGEGVGSALRRLETDRETLKDDFALNQLARKHFREAKRLAREESEKDQALAKRLSLLDSGVQLLPEDESDRKSAKILRLAHLQKANESKVTNARGANDVLFHSLNKPSSSNINKQSRPADGTTTVSANGSLLSSENISIDSQPSVKSATAFICSERLKQRTQAFELSMPGAFSKTVSSEALGIRVGSKTQAPTNNSVDLVSYDDSGSDE